MTYSYYPRLKHRRATDPEFLEKSREQVRRYNRRVLLGADPDSTTRPMPDTCEACGEEGKAPKGKVSKLHWDHDHETGKFRGWLCSKCNWVAGMLERNEPRMPLVRAYLDKYKN